MRALIALAALGNIGALTAVAQPLEPPPPAPEPDMMGLEETRIARTRDLNVKSRIPMRDARTQIDAETAARWEAARQAKRAAKAARALTIRDAQLARGQRTA